MVSVRRDDAVLSSNRGLHANSNRFLAVVQVTEAPNELGLVERVGGDLHPTHQRHISEEAHELLIRRLDGARRRIDVVGAEGEISLDGDGGGGIGGEVAEGGDRHRERIQESSDSPCR